MYFLLFNSKISTLMSDAVAKNTLVNRRLKTSPLKKKHLFTSLRCFGWLRWSDRFRKIFISILTSQSVLTCINEQENKQTTQMDRRKHKLHPLLTKCNSPVLPKKVHFVILYICMCCFLQKVTLDKVPQAKNIFQMALLPQNRTKWWMD